VDDWRDIRVGDLVDAGLLVVSDGHRVRNEELGPVGIPFVRGGDIGDGWIDTNVADHVRPELADRVAPKLSQPGDVAIITKGSVGRVGRLRDGQSTIVLAPQVSWWRVLDRDVIDPTFLFHLLRGPSFQASLYSVMTHGSMVADYVSISQQLDFSLRLPPILEQRRIAGILGALDDKIELNRRLVLTLEGLARAAYAELQATRADECSAGSIADVALNPRDQVDPRQVDPSTPYIGLEHVPRSRMVLGEWGQAVNAESGKMAFQRNDILFGKLRPYFRKVGVVPTSGICSTDILVIRTRRPEDLGYVLAVATDAAFIEASNAASTGTRMPRTSWGDLVRYPLLVPPTSARAAFTKRVWPLIERAQAAVFETRTLEQIRDTLLPRLLSGDIEVAA